MVGPPAERRQAGADRQPDAEDAECVGGKLGQEEEKRGQRRQREHRRDKDRAARMRSHEADGDRRPAAALPPAGLILPSFGRRLAGEH